MTKSPQLKTFLWFPGNMDDALAFYQEHMGAVIHGDHVLEPGSKRFTADFTIYGHDFIGLNWPGGPEFNDAISLSLNVDGQEEVDRLWNAITKDGAEGQCGWCKDAWGVSWQVTSPQMVNYLNGKDPEGAKRATQAMLEMTKIDLAAMERAYLNG